MVKFELAGASLEGDVNGDGEVNVSDVTALVGIVLNDDGKTQHASSVDVNGDGEVNVGDVTALIGLILNQ